MDGNKTNKFLLATTILSVTIMIIGATFSYFTLSSRSEVNAVTVEAGKIALGLGVSNLTSGIKLIPANDEDIMTAYEHNCIDDKGFGACNIFQFNVTNFDGIQDVTGTVDFEIDGITNLKYMVLDDEDNVYVDGTELTDGTNSNKPLGEHFILEHGSEINPDTRIFKLIVWLSNYDREQDTEDAGGKYSAIIKYTTVDGGILTGTINGIG